MPGGSAYQFIHAVDASRLGLFSRQASSGKSSSFDYIDFAVLDLRRTREFYARLLGPLGIASLVDIAGDDDRDGTGFVADGIPRFWIGKGPAIAGRLHVAFVASSHEAVAAFHAAGLAAGGTGHGRPGLRRQYAGNYYAAYVRDPDGHGVEAICRNA